MNSSDIIPGVLLEHKYNEHLFLILSVEKDQQEPISMFSITYKILDMMTGITSYICAADMKKNGGHFFKVV